VSPSFAAGIDVATLSGLVAAIDRQNAVWVEAARRFSPGVLVELLDVSGRWVDAYFAGLDLEALGMPVAWVGPDPAPVWLDVAREYTERWVHQQEIRDAAGRPGLEERPLLAPVLETFVRALPVALANAEAPDGTAVRLVVTGEAGGEWVAMRRDDRWHLGRKSGPEAAAIVTLDQETAWRLFTKGIATEEARRVAAMAGDAVLGERVLGTVAILG
jgi:hypothetical protein